MIELNSYLREKENQKKNFIELIKLCTVYKRVAAYISRASLEEDVTTVTVITELTDQHNKLITN
jgi:sulfur relay (sulfurtransferase) DsrF/TusC family protein